MTLLKKNIIFMTLEKWRYIERKNSVLRLVQRDTKVKISNISYKNIITH